MHFKHNREASCTLGMAAEATGYWELPTNGVLCVFGRDLRVFIPLVFVGKEKATGGCFYIVLSKRKYDSLFFKHSTPEDSLSLTYVSIQGCSGI